MAAKTQKTKKPVKTVKVPKKAVKKVITVATATPTGVKQKIISEFAKKSGDTGSPEVQVALISQRIEKLVTHLKTNTNDNHSRRGLLGMVSKRRRLLNYLKDKDEKRFKEVSQRLHLTK